MYKRQRQLERELGKLLRKTATRIAAGDAEPPITIDVAQLRDALGRVPPATLTVRLTELVTAGLLERRVLDTKPPAVEYRLTPLGRRFEPLLRALGHCARTSRPA